MSTLRTKRSGFPFMVADTDAGPEIQWQGFRLTLSFTTFQGERCRVNFIDVEHFELLSDTELDCKIFPYDGAVEVIDSPLVRQLVYSGSLTRADATNFTHLVIGFNTIGAYLVVLYREMEVQGV